MPHFWLPRAATLVAALSCIALALSPRPAPAAQPVRISGTGAAVGGMKLVAAAFAGTHPGFGVSVLPSTGSTGGIRAVLDGKLDLACSSRPLTPAEERAGAQAEPYARTAIVFGTRSSGPSPGFTLREIEEIYSGRRGSWPDGSRIRLSLRPPSDAFTRYIGALTPGMKEALERAAAIPGVFVGSTDQDAAEYIERTPGSFGATSLSLILAEQRKIQALPVDGVRPSERSIADGSYRYVLPLFIVYRAGRLSGPAARFVEFLFSREAAAVLARSGHAPVGRRAAAP